MISQNEVRDPVRSRGPLIRDRIPNWRPSREHSLTGSGTAAGTASTGTNPAEWPNPIEGPGGRFTGAFFSIAWCCWYLDGRLKA